MSEKFDEQLAKQKLSDDVVEKVKSHAIYETGYARPPQEHRFQKGQSGNPRGRPRSAPADLELREQPLLQAVLQASKRKVTLRKNGKLVEITEAEAIVESINVSAIKGNARAQGLALDQIRRAQEAHAHEVRRLNEIWSSIQASRRAVIDEARRQGEPEPVLFPHPDDIVIDLENGPRFQGPMGEEDQRRLENTLGYRDTLIKQSALDERMGGDPQSARLLAMLLEHCIPPRLRLSTSEWIRRELKYGAMLKRSLLKEVYRSWQRIGVPHRRGTTFPEFARVERSIKIRLDLVREAVAGNLDLDAMARGEYDETALRFMEERGLRV